jgi:hypothetical protein
MNKEERVTFDAVLRILQALQRSQVWGVSGVGGVSVQSGWLCGR